jgi:hypothetical protein
MRTGGMILEQWTEKYKNSSVWQRIPEITRILTN